MSRNGSSRPKDKHFDVRLSQQTHTAERSSKNFIVRRNDKSANTVTRTHKPPPIVSAERTLETSSQQSLTTVYFEQDFYEYIVVPVALLVDRPVLRAILASQQTREITLSEREVHVDVPTITCNLDRFGGSTLWVKLNVGQIWKEKFSFSCQVDKKKAIFQKIKTNVDTDHISEVNTYEVDFLQPVQPTLSNPSQPPMHPEAAHHSYLKKIINSRIEEVKKGSGLRRASKDGFKKTSAVCLDHPGTLPILTTSREISQYGAFKRSIASVSTNNQSIRIMPIRKEPLRKKPVQSTTSVDPIEPLPIEPQNKSISNESYLEKMRKFQNNLGSSSHETQYVQEEIEVTVPLDLSEEFGELPKIAPQQRIKQSNLAESGLVESAMVQSSSLAVSLYE